MGCARGGFEISLEWRDRALGKARVRSLNGGVCRIRGGVPLRVTLDGQRIDATSPEPGVIAFATKRGAAYTIEPASTRFEQEKTVRISVSAMMM